VPESPDNTGSPERQVCEGVAAADRRRRAREARRLAWQLAPIVAGSALALAALCRWLGLPGSVPAVALGAGALVVAVAAVIARRARIISDADATAIDQDAGLRGELRSAHWFAGRERRDDWAELHLTRAAERLQQINWAELYPPTPAGRAQAATVVCVIATIALSVTMPQRGRVKAESRNAAAKAAEQARAQSGFAGRLLSPELQKELEALLAAAANGALPSAEDLASNPQTREMLDKLNQMSDAELLDALRRALANAPDAKAQAALDALNKLAEQARQAGENTGLPKELQDALEKLSDELEIAKGDSTEASDETGQDGAQQAQSGEGGARPEKLSIDFARQQDASGGAGMMMMASQDAAQAGGPPGAGVGGGGDGDTAGAAAAMIDAALTKEVVEASEDKAGTNVETEIRRETEHGNATVGFTGSAAGDFDRARASAPPPVPEARRSGVQTYFVRKPK
jgi:hypothetical protein